MTKMTAVCGAAFVLLLLLRIWITVRGRRFVRVGTTAGGTEVIVRRVGEVRELVLADGAHELVQSRSDGSGYQREFHRAMRETPRPKRLLFLGGGAGVVPMQFSRRYPEATIDVVEKEPLVALAAKKHFDFVESESLRLHVMDARDFVREAPRGSFDLVVFDLYDARGIPPELTTFEIFASIRGLVGERGALVVNLTRPVSERTLATLRDVFSSVVVDEVTEENALVTARATGRGSSDPSS